VQERYNLKIGIEVIIVSMISILEETQKFVKWSQYAPIGGRGLSSNGELTYFVETGNDAASFMRKQNELTTLAIA